MRHVRHVVLLFALIALAGSGCNGTQLPPDPDGSLDAIVDQWLDGSLDTVEDLGLDGAPDVVADRGPQDGAQTDTMAPPSTWATSASGTPDVSSYSIAVDGLDNSYITGSFKGTAIFGTTTLTSKGMADTFVAKVTTGGKIQWAVSAGGTHDVIGRSIVVDGSGNSYITGWIWGTATFGSLTLTTPGLRLFVAKVDSGGKFVWAIKAGGDAKTNSMGQSIAMGGSGNCYVTGHFTGTATFGSTTLSSNGHRDIFVAKVNSSGIFIWAVSDGGTGPDENASIAVDSSGSSFVTGSFYGSTKFGSTTLNSKWIYGLFVTKLDSSGKFVWAVSSDGISEWSDSIAVDGLGNSYITGWFNSTAIFGTTTLTSKGSDDIFVAKLDSGGKFVWAVSAGGTSHDDVDSIAVDKTGNSYFAGSIKSTATFGSTTLTAKVASDLFVAKLDSGGKFIWAVSSGGTGGEGVNGLAVDGFGNSYITGHFGGTTTIGSTTLISKGNSNIYVAKLNKSGKF